MLQGGESSGASAERRGRGGPGSNVRVRFEATVLPHMSSVYRIARALASENEADDLVQETFARAYRGFGRFELRDCGAKPWLLRILQNVYYNHVGRRRREPCLLDHVELDHFVDEFTWTDELQAYTDSVNWELFDEELKSAVAELPAEYRVVLLLWSIEGLSYREIAGLCECALGTVMSRLYRARQIVGRRLSRYARARKLSTARFD